MADTPDTRNAVSKKMDQETSDAGSRILSDDECRASATHLLNIARNRLLEILTPTQEDHWQLRLIEYALGRGLRSSSRETK